MNFAQLLTQIMFFLQLNLLDPIQVFLQDNGLHIVDLGSLELNFGVGQITWFSINAYDLLIIVIGFMVSITALVLTWKFLKFLNGFIKGLFTGIKR